MTAEPRKADVLNRTRLREALEKAHPDGIRDFRVVGDRQRLYSRVWDVEVETASGKAAYIVKNAGDRAARQAALIQEAAKLFATVPHVFIPGAIRLDRHGLLLLEKFSGQSLVSVAEWRVGENPFSWLKRLRECIARTGLWLKMYHSATRQAGSRDGGLLRYVTERTQTVQSLSPSTRQTLLEAVARPVDSDSVVSHGDFTPGNVMFRDQTICVVDFGIREWVRMSPWWDVVSMTVGLKRHIAFSPRNPVRWISALGASLEESFFKAYDGPCREVTAYWTCLAVRHLGFLSGYDETARRGDKRARWHNMEIKRALAHLRT